MNDPNVVVSVDDLAGAEARLRMSGHRLTPQRRAILRVFFDQDQHLTAAQVHSMIVAERPDTSLVTVYRTLDMLIAVGVLVRLNLRDGADRYELSAGYSAGGPANRDAGSACHGHDHDCDCGDCGGDSCGSAHRAHSRQHHHHILCTGCGAVAEFDDCLVDTLSDRLSQLTGFSVTDHWMEMWGLCSHCRAAGAQSRKVEV
jgi:Fe2+ or Zn2+ uptake regulation protein